MPRLLLSRRLAAAAGVTAIAVALLGSPPATAQRPSEPRSLQQALHDYLVGRDGHVTVAVDDLATGQRVRHRPGHRQRTASIVKVEILMTLLARQHAPLRPDRAAQARRMVEHSSNADAQALWELIGGSRGLAAFGRRAGLTHTDPAAARGPGYAWGLTRTTSGDQLRLLALLAQPNPVLTDLDRRYVRHLMTHVEPDQRWGITAGPPAAAVVAVKNGWLPLRAADWQINSIGRVRTAHRDYSIAVLTTGSPSMGYGVHTVERVSRIVWRHLRAVGPSAVP